MSIDTENQLFSTAAHQEIEKKITEFLNSNSDGLPRDNPSPRTVGDKVQDLLAQNMQSILGEFCATGKYETAFSRKAMEDFAFSDANGIRYVVDVKTHWLDAGFSMPNIVSVDRLTKLYENEKNCFVLLIVDYRIITNRITVEKTTFVPIEFISWSCLTLGALGKGQIQIKNAHRIVVDPSTKRSDWMILLCERAEKFYEKRISRIQKLLKELPTIRAKWEDRSQAKDATGGGDNP